MIIYGFLLDLFRDLIYITFCTSNQLIYLLLLDPTLYSNCTRCGNVVGKNIRKNVEINIFIFYIFSQMNNFLKFEKIEFRYKYQKFISIYHIMIIIQMDLVQMSILCQKILNWQIGEGKLSPEQLVNIKNMIHLASFNQEQKKRILRRVRQFQIAIGFQLKHRKLVKQREKIEERMAKLTNKKQAKVQASNWMNKIKDSIYKCIGLKKNKQKALFLSYKQIKQQNQDQLKDDEEKYLIMKQKETGK